MTTPTPEIATLPPLPALRGDRPVSSRTGEPPRPWPIVTGLVLSMVAAAVIVGVYSHHWWLAAHPDTYLSSAQVISWLDPDPGKWLSLTIETGLACFALVAAGACGVSGFQAWNGWSWSRFAGPVAALLSAVAAMLFSWWAWPAIVLMALVSISSWLPSSRSYFDHWQRLRAARPQPYRRPERIFYGRLPRYR